MSNFKLTASVPPMTWAILPTWTPRSLTLPPGSITRPARSEVNVTGTSDANHPANKAVVSTMIPTITLLRIRVHHPGWIRGSPARLDAMPLARQVEVAGLPVYGQRDCQDYERPHDERRAHCAAHRLPYAGRPARGSEAVEGVHQHDCEPHHDHRE